jgi:DNA-directed RNA polymerase subunit RPC12/RpoP
MKPSAVTCPHCGSSSLRRSRRKAWFEFVGMLAGTYPFRCLDCSQRFWVSIWLFSRLKYAKCPKCLGSELTTWSRRHQHLNLWQNLISTFGAHRYRCSGCRCNFLSFRPCQVSGPAQTGEATTPAEPLAVETETVSESRTNV